MAVPGKVRDRLVSGIKRLVPIVQQQKVRDVSEADTVTLVKDLLADVFGYDKYTELTSEHSIRGTFCDLAVKVADKLSLLIEVKSAGTTLDARHVKQAIDYAANQGCEWVILTNGSIWQFYQVMFAKPIDKRLLAEIDITATDTRKEADLERIMLLTKEGFLKGHHIELRDRQDATSRYLVAALLVNNESVLNTIRRELRRVVDVVVDESDVINVLRNEVIKRDALEGVEADAAVKKVNRTGDRSIRKAREASSTDASKVTIEPEGPVAETT